MPDDGVKSSSSAASLPVSAGWPQTTAAAKRSLQLSTAPDLPPVFRAMRFETRTLTNWHYEAAALAAGAITF